MAFLEIRGPKTGQCNICGKEGPLTEDHTPPKSCLRPTTVVLKYIGDHISLNKTDIRKKILQNGVRYRSLCAECNNHRLGIRYDPAMSSFTNQIVDYISTARYYPDTISINASPQKLMRSILGHLSAQGINRYQKGEITEPCRDYFLDETLPLPPDMKIYYWLYPYKTQILARDAAYLDLPTGATANIWIMKFFPVAFAIVWDKSNKIDFSALHELSSWRDIPIDTVQSLQIRLRNPVHQFWPQVPSDKHVMLYGREAIFAVEHKPQAQR